MAGENPKSIRVTVSLSPQDHAELNALAIEAKVSLAWLVRYAVADLLKRHREGAELQLPLRL